MNILTFDIEDWFHILDNDSTKTAKEWVKYESRLQQNIEFIFSLLDECNVKATFFCLGWIARQYPHILKEIDKRGYEIGSHTNNHQLVHEQTQDEFRNDLRESVRIIEDSIGKKVKYFRAPGFSITECEKWAFALMAEEGIEADFSVFPAPHGHGGFPSFKVAQPSIIEYQGMSIKEFPINTIKFLGKPLIFSGGGYFRLLPYPVIKYFASNADYMVAYFHPRDFDPGQPVIKDLNLLRKFKSYVGLSTSQSKARKFLSDFAFIDVNEAIATIDWSKARKVIL